MFEHINSEVIYYLLLIYRRRFEVYFKTSSDTKSLPIRDVKASSIGKLINIKGIITRATEVKPMMQVQ